MNLAVLVPVVLLGGCAPPDYRDADLQLDILAPLPEGAENLRVCVDGWGTYTLGAGNGRAAVTGLEPNAEYEVTVNVYDDNGMVGVAGPIAMGASRPWVEVDYRAGAELDCTADGAPVAAGDESWMLAVRFAEEETPWDQL